MTTNAGNSPRPIRPRCCPCGGCDDTGGMSRRDFLKVGGAAVGGLALTGLAWSSLAAEAQSQLGPAPGRTALVVKPVLSYEVPRRRPQTSWRSWGGIATDQEAQQEVARIQGELDKLQASADFPVKFLRVSAIRGGNTLAGADDVASADVVVVYAAGGGMGLIDAALKADKHVIVFMRHKSGPVYLWYEIISPRYLHQHTDKLGVKGIDNHDMVVDSTDELLWRLRALCGLKNTLGTRIVAIGGPGAWARPANVVTGLVTKLWKMDIQTVPYPELAKLIQAAMDDKAAVELAKKRADEYLKLPGTNLETEKTFVENAFLLEQVFRGLMAKAAARAITVNNCMGTIMPMAKTTACLTLSLLNDAGFMAFCESDFVVIPSGVLLVNISNHPQFLNDPTYPHDGVITLAHCTAPRKMNGKDLEAARILTHFESDYGAAPKVEMKKGQKVTMVIPDFASARWVGVGGEIADAPFLPICRSQIDVAYKVPDIQLAQNMPGFHWQCIYGDYLREVGYALKKVPIGWDCLG